MLIIPNFVQFAQHLQRAKRAVHDNPPRPAELTAIYDRIEQWASRSMQWLTQNAKMDKPVDGQRWVTRGIAFMAADDAKRFAKQDPAKWGLTPAEADQLPNMCPRAGMCRAVCLVSSGQMGLPASKNAQMRRTFAFQFERDAFYTMAIIAIGKMWKQARKERRKLGIRLNVTSDLPWEDMPVTIDPWLADYVRRFHGLRIAAGTYPNICEALPQVTFYDYTKIEERMDRFIDRRFPRNYFLTWSFAENPLNRLETIKVLTSGAASVAVPFNVRSRKLPNGQLRPLPKTLTVVDNSPGKPEVAYTFRVVDADKHDLRFLDPGRYSSDGKAPGVFAGLRFKVPKKKALLGKSADQKALAGGEFIVRAVDASGALNEHPVVKVFRARGPQTNPQVGRRLRAIKRPWFGSMRDVLLELRRRRGSRANPHRCRGRRAGMRR